MFTADGVLTIYSLGDSIFLSNVLNGIAMITTGGDSADDRGSFLYITAIGAMFGFILTALRGLQTGKAFDLNSLMLCIIAWYFFFGWNVTVGIRDVFHNEDRLVAHVPGGVALTGSAISSLGWGLTSIYEQAFMPVTAEGGIAKGLSEGAAFADTAKTLNTLTALGGNPALLTALDSGKPGNPGKRVGMRENIVNYINECTMTAVDLGYKNLSDVFRMSVVPDSSSSSGSGDGPVSENSALSFSNGGNVYMTTYDGESYNCDTALGKMNADIDSALKRTAAGGVIATMINTTAESPAGGTSRALASSDPAGQESISRAFQKIDGIMGMLGKDSETAQNMMKASIYYHLFPLGAASNALAAGDRATATMLEQARLQRNTQWSSEGTMFQQTMLPIMTFIEGFTYAVTPFMGLFLLLGMFGVSLSIKYFMLVAWVQSWMPCLAIANNYIDSSIQRALSGLGTNAANNVITGRLDSFTAVMHVMDVAQNHIATAGMFIGAIPIITLFIFSGSIYALSSLTSRMNGAEFVNEKIATPDMISPASVMSMMSQATSQNGVTQGTGYENGLGKISLNVGGMTSQMAAEQNSHAINKLFSTGFGTQAAEIVREELANKKGFVGEELSSGRFENAKNATLQLGNALGKAVGFKENSQQSLKLGIAVGAGLKIAGTGLSGDLGISEEQAKVIDANFANNKSFQQMRSDAIQGGLGEAMSAGYSKMVEEGAARGGNASKARSFEDAASDTQSRITNYTKTDQVSVNAGTSKEIGVHQVAQKLEGNTKLQQEISKRWQEQAETNTSFTEEALNAKLEGYDRLGLKASPNTLRATAMADLMTSDKGDKGFENRVFLGNKLLGNSDNGAINTADQTGVNPNDLQENLQNKARAAKDAYKQQVENVNSQITQTSAQNGYTEYKKRVNKFGKDSQNKVTKESINASDQINIDGKNAIITQMRAVSTPTDPAGDISKAANNGDLGSVAKSILSINSVKDLAKVAKGVAGMTTSMATKRTDEYVDNITNEGVKELDSMATLLGKAGTHAEQNFKDKVLLNWQDENTDFSKELLTYANISGSSVTMQYIENKDSLARAAASINLQQVKNNKEDFDLLADTLGLEGEEREKLAHTLGVDEGLLATKTTFGRPLIVNKDDLSLHKAVEQTKIEATKSREELFKKVSSVLDNKTANSYIEGIDRISNGTADAETIDAVTSTTNLINSLIRQNKTIYD